MKTIPLTKGFEAKVDDEDYEFLMQWKWSVVQCGRSHYAQRAIWISERKNIKVYMHRVLVGVEGLQVDHIDHNGLNNQKSNLRVATKSENLSYSRLRIDSKSGFKGVSWNSRRKKWESTIASKRKLYHLGRFSTQIEAAKAYDEAAISLHGSFALTNETLGLLHE